MVLNVSACTNHIKVNNLFGKLQLKCDLHKSFVKKYAVSTLKKQLLLPCNCSVPAFPAVITQYIFRHDHGCRHCIIMQSVFVLFFCFSLALWVIGGRSRVLV